MATRYAHTNLVAADWKALAAFYQRVFNCTIVPPLRDQSGEWLEKGTGVQGAALKGAHLRLPGYGETGPTLEIFSYAEMEERPEPLGNRKGFGHIAFAVDDVAQTLAKVISAGGKAVGEVVTREVPGAGIITFVYAADPEGNLLELQAWKKAEK
jgi:predicted enzyme related to lactoylglutathione lyase